MIWFVYAFLSERESGGAIWIKTSYWSELQLQAPASNWSLINMDQRQSGALNKTLLGWYFFFCLIGFGGTWKRTDERGNGSAYQSVASTASNVSFPTVPYRQWSCRSGSTLDGIRYDCAIHSRDTWLMPVDTRWHQIGLCYILPRHLTYVCGILLEYSLGVCVCEMVQLEKY